MMKRLYVLLLLAVLAALVLAEWGGTDAGYILISRGGLSIEMTFWTGLLLLATGFILFYYLARLTLTIIRGVERVTRSAKPRYSSPARLDRTSLAAGYFIAGDWRKAERKLKRAADKSEAPLLNYLLAARASHAIGDTEKTERYLSLAADQGAAVAPAVLLTRAELQLQSARSADALETLSELSGSASAHPVALRLRIEATRNLHRWEDLLVLVGTARRSEALATERLDELEHEASLNLLEQAAESDPGATAIISQWRKFPARLRQDGRIVARYCALLSARQQGPEAERVLRKLLKKQWDSNLVLLYGEVKGEDPQKQLSLAESWLRDHRNDAQLLLTLGRLCLQNRLWGKARDYLEASVACEPVAESCAELGRLYQHLGEQTKSLEMFERGLAGSTRLTALPMPD